MSHYNQSVAGFSPATAKVLVVSSSLAPFGGGFPEEMVDEIQSQCSFPHKMIMWPAIIAIRRFIVQPGTAAYMLLERKKTGVDGEPRLTDCPSAQEKKHPPDSA
jgi:hypothetical protein